MFEVPEEGFNMDPSPAHPQGIAEQLGAPEDLVDVPPPSPGQDGTAEQGLPDLNPLAEVQSPSLRLFCCRHCLAFCWRSAQWCALHSGHTTSTQLLLSR